MVDRRTVLKGGFVLAASSHTVGEASAVGAVPETDQAKLKRLAWEISDILNNLEPAYDYVTIQPSSVGKGAVLFMFNIDQNLVMREDPLLDAIRAYQHGLAEFNKDSADEDWEGLSARTYEPHLHILDEWTAPATTRESAIEALRISLTNKNGVRGNDAADCMVRAAIGYLEGIRS